MSAHSEPRKRSYWLIASILINILLIGSLGGYFLGGGDSEGRAGNTHGHHAELMPEKATDADKKAVRAVMRGAFESTAVERAASREARQKLAAAIDSDPYDVTAIRAALAEMRMTEAAVQEAIHESLASNMSDLTRRQRQGVVQALKGGRRGRGKKRRDEGDDKPPAPPR
jgi:uncharacterized membrane protein